MTARLALPARREGRTTFFHFKGNPKAKFYVSWSVVDGRVVEVFLQGGKSGSEVEALARDCAVLASLALQHGCELETIQKALTRDDTGQAAGPMGAAADTVRKHLNEEPMA